MRPHIETTIYSWDTLMFPLWREPRPQYEMLCEFTEKLLRQHVRCEVIRSGGEDGDRKGWVEWKLALPIEESRRVELQTALEEIFGEPGKHFSWNGAGVLTRIFNARALGQHIQ